MAYALMCGWVSAQSFPPITHVAPVKKVYRLLSQSIAVFLVLVRFTDRGAKAGKTAIMPSANNSHPALPKLLQQCVGATFYSIGHACRYYARISIGKFHLPPTDKPSQGQPDFLCLLQVLPPRKVLCNMREFTKLDAQ